MKNITNAFTQIQTEIGQAHELRKPYLKKLKAYRGGRAVVSFFISFFDTQPLSQQDADMLEEVLMNTDTSKGVTLLLDAPGGDGLAAERIIQVCRAYSGEDFEAIVPSRAKSAATMVCLGADRILMSPTSELGPIDPQVAMDLGSGAEWVAAHHIIRSYETLLSEARTLANGHIEPYLQQLAKHNSVNIERLKAATRLAEDIAINSLAAGMMKDKKPEEIKARIQHFTNPELTMSHGRGIYPHQAKEAGLVVEEIAPDCDEWKVIWTLYQRSTYVVNGGSSAKMIETEDVSFVGNTRR